MTHEFKTPIATINLALDAIKNPKVIDDFLKWLNQKYGKHGKVTVTQGKCSNINQS